MPEIIVRVLTGGEFVECVRRRRWALPDGRAAVVYAGRLLPIRSPGCHIEVSDDFFPLEEPTALESGASINHTIRIYLDCSRNTARLMVEGDAVVRDFVAATLDEAAVLAKTVDTTCDTADDGRCHDWCFEFEKDHLATELKHYFGSHIAAPSYRSSVAGLTSANVEVRQDGLNQVRGVSAESDACRLITTRLRDLLSVNAAQRGRDHKSRSAIDMAKWQQQVVNGPKMAEELFEELGKADHIIQRVNREKAALTEERDLLQIRVAKKVSFASILAEVFPEIDFVRDSSATIDQTFTSVKSLGSALRAIMNDAPEMSRNPIRGARTDWYEVHVATGRRSDGRIYFHRVSQSQV